jgi:cytochrome c biogenesis factor
MLAVIVFMVLLLVKDPFEATHPFTVNYSDGTTGIKDPANYPGGNGLNPMLRNIWMSIHPPLLFLGYAWITIPFGASLAYSITGDKRWTMISTQWSRLAWLFLTLGIGIGALWAYVAIGWGGYWFWDAVEVGGLVPWLTLTALMHTQIRNKRNDEYGIISPILATLTFVLVIFATFVTRSGLWTSVHAWSETEVGQILLATMILTLVFSSIIILRSFIIRHSASVRRDENYKYLPESWNSYLMYGTFIIFMFLTLITFIGLIVTMKSPNPGFYETRLAPVIFIMLMVLSICLAWRFFGKDNLLHIVLWTAIAGLACATLFPRYGVFQGVPESFYGSVNTHHVNGFLIPFVLLVIFSSIFKMYKQLRLKSLRKKLDAISPHFIHIGVALIIISYGMSQTMVIDETGRVAEGGVVEVGNYQVKLVDINIVEDTGNIDSNEYWDTWFVTVELYKDNEFVKEGEMNVIYSYTYDETGRRVYTMIMTSEVFVVKLPFEDVYINFKGFTDSEVDVTVQVIPLMQILWGGMWLFTLGIVIRIAVNYFPGRKERQIEDFEPQPKKRTSHKGVSRKREGPKRDDKDYEKMLDDELENL